MKPSKRAAAAEAPGSGSHRLRGLLVISEMALAMVALIGAGLFYRSFRNASGIQPGFDRTNISVSQFYLSYAGYSAQEQRDFCRNLRERLESKPGVIGVTYSDVIPMSTASGAGSTPWHQLDVEGYAPAPNEQMMIHRATVPPGYFNLLGIRMLEGRDFTERDAAGEPSVIIVNETFANRFFNGRNPIGRKVQLRGHAGHRGRAGQGQQVSHADRGPDSVLLHTVPPMVRARSELLRSSSKPPATRCG